MLPLPLVLLSLHVNLDCVDDVVAINAYCALFFPGFINTVLLNQKPTLRNKFCLVTFRSVSCFFYPVSKPFSLRVHEQAISSISYCDETVSLITRIRWTSQIGSRWLSSKVWFGNNHDTTVIIMAPKLFCSSHPLIHTFINVLVRSASRNGFIFNFFFVSNLVSTLFFFYRMYL